jgi:hypothetical protein
MRSDLLVSVTSNRAGDARAILLPFSLAHTVLGIILAWSPAGLEDSSVQLAIAAWTVLGSLWSAMTMDGVLADIGAGAKDMDEEMANSHIGRNWAKIPFGALRAVSVVIVVLLVLAELMAIY